MTEDCFQKTPLDFAPTSRIVFRNGSSVEFTPTLLSNGTTPEGSIWAMNPIPTDTEYAQPCPQRSGPVDAPTAYLRWGKNPTDCSGTWPTTLSIEDTVLIPKDIEPGEYVLGFRWDCEETTQERTLMYSSALLSSRRVMCALRHQRALVRSVSQQIWGGAYAGTCVCERVCPYACICHGLTCGACPVHADLAELQ